MLRGLAALLLACALIGCAAGGDDAPGAPPDAVLRGYAPAVAQNAVREATIPTIVAVREALEVLAPPRPTKAPEDRVHSAAVALIVAFEVTSPAYYEQRLRRPIWPGGASGATWCIGYDGGHQTPGRIRADWHSHDQVERLAGTAGVVGQAARELVARLQDVSTPWPPCVEVFERSTLPDYHARTKQAFEDGWEALPRPAQGALVSLVYNRGTSMLGDSRREMRALRDRCVPAGDVTCIAAEIRSMCRLWLGTPNETGLCRRRDAEAGLAESSDA